MQHDVFVNPNRQTREAFPFIAVLQADVADSKERIVVRAFHGRRMDDAAGKT
jgi:hypothetical protein